MIAIIAIEFQGQWILDNMTEQILRDPVFHFLNSGMFVLFRP